MRADRRRRSQNGNVLIEFAIAASFLATAFAGVYQVGHSLYTYNSLTSAVRAGARYASLARISNYGDRSVPAAFKTAVQNMVVYGTATPSGADQPVVPGLTVDKVVVDIGWYPSSPVPMNVSVSIRGYSIDAVFQTLTVNGKPAFSMPYFGRYCSAGTGC